jgi:hypothetical protein
MPSAVAPSLEEFVTRLHLQIERYTATHEADRSHVEVELIDGTRVMLHSLSSEPGYGFLTLTVHPEGDGGADQVIVPVSSIRRIALGPADEERRPGFALPTKEKGPGSAA